MRHDCPHRTFTQRRVRGKEWCSPRLISILVRQRGGVFGGKKEETMRNGFIVNDRRVGGKRGSTEPKRKVLGRGEKKEKGERGGSVVNYSRRRMRWGRRRGMGGGGGGGKLQG